MKNGKVYTPIEIIDEMLNEIDFNNKFIGKKILEPACGNGNFLVEMVKRVLQYSNNKKNDLENIYGWEITLEDVLETKKRLNKLIGDLKINWKIFCVDSLKEKEDNFDLIIGNPPYIKIQDLNEEQRDTLKNFKYCQFGSTDIYLAFFELGFNKLNKDGILCYITPNSFLSTQSAKILRKELKNHFFKIKNHGTVKKFNGVSTYTAISYISKKEVKEIKYELYEVSKIFSTKKLEDASWNFYFQNENLTPLKDIINIRTGIATLSDKVYIFQNYKKEKNGYLVYSRESKKYELIEFDILKPIIKGSQLKNGEIIKELVLWVYDKTGKPYEEDYLIKNFPNAYKYLLSMKERLAQRDKGKGEYPKWYCFGRSQGLIDSFGEKFFFSPISKIPNFIFSDTDATIYSGYYFKYSGDKEKLLKVLNSNEMQEYINYSGRDLGDGWKSYTKSIVERFRIDKNLL